MVARSDAVGDSARAVGTRHGRSTLGPLTTGWMPSPCLPPRRSTAASLASPRVGARIRPAHDLPPRVGSRMVESCARPAPRRGSSVAPITAFTVCMSAWAGHAAERCLRAIEALRARCPENPPFTRLYIFGLSSLPPSGWSCWAPPLATSPPTSSCSPPSNQFWADVRRGSADLPSPS